MKNAMAVKFTTNVAEMQNAMATQANKVF